jgi:hypothetical protein
VSLRLQSASGLRLEESLKVEPGIADHGDHLVLKPSGTKGGRSREIPIRSAEQRLLTEQAKLLAGRGSLMPNHLRYIDQCQRFNAQIQKPGIRNVYGLRHHYAQARYQEITGLACTKQGGPKRGELSREQRETDKAARLEISGKLGYGRTTVGAIHLDRQAGTRRSITVDILHRSRVPANVPPHTAGFARTRSDVRAPVFLILPYGARWIGSLWTC